MLYYFQVYSFLHETKAQPTLLECGSLYSTHAVLFPAALQYIYAMYNHTLCCRFELNATITYHNSYCREGSCSTATYYCTVIMWNSSFYFNFNNYDSCFKHLIESTFCEK